MRVRDPIPRRPHAGDGAHDPSSRARTRLARHHRGPRAQQGAVVLVALLVLAVSLMLASAALESAVVQEKLAGNTRDRAAAFESQEATAKNAQDYVRWLTSSGQALPDNTAGNYVARSVADSSGSMQANVDTARIEWWTTQSLTTSNSIESSLPSPSALAPKGRFLVEHQRYSDESEPGSATVYEPSYKTIIVTGRGVNGAEVTSQTTLVVLPR